MAWILEERTLSTLLLPLHLLLKPLDQLIILAHHYSTIICLTCKQPLGLSVRPPPTPTPTPLADHSIPSTHWYPGSSFPAHFTAL
ncbi:hypothetical protein ILYODFUR_016233 [Ilyodon furcidens]|uniref:Uncharacterized protein n=1 Tax=Ilyodon furcidens TaxID=33524 RepID=A0ABV0SYW7_9TELE